ncbi:MAG: gfo/Idh/MocA family oxidoreductase, partial [Armatimonadia bacterium]
KGTAEVYPLERHWDRHAPLQVRLTLQEANAEYAAGTHMVDAGVMNYRYDAQLVELAHIINGEIENPYPYEHELLVEEVVLAAAAYTQWNA